MCASVNSVVSWASARIEIHLVNACRTSFVSFSPLSSSIGSSDCPPPPLRVTSCLLFFFLVFSLVLSVSPKGDLILLLTRSVCAKRFRVGSICEISFLMVSTFSDTCVSAIWVSTNGVPYAIAMKHLNAVRDLAGSSPDISNTRPTSCSIPFAIFLACVV